MKIIYIFFNQQMHVTKVLTLIFLLIVHTNGSPDTKKHRFKREEADETVECKLFLFCFYLLGNLYFCLI